MNSVALHRGRLAGMLSALSVDDMAWAMKFLTDKLSQKVNGVSTALASNKKAKDHERTERFLASVWGKWEEGKDADDMVREIYESRANKDFREIEKMFD